MSDTGFFDLWDDYENYDFGVKCECGTTITMGDDDSWEFHSDYCPCKIAKKVPKKKEKTNESN